MTDGPAPANAPAPAAEPPPAPDVLAMSPRDAVARLALGAPCPACGKPLEGSAGASALYASDALRCSTCGLKAPPVRSALGSVFFGLAAALFVAVLLGASWAVAELNGATGPKTAVVLGLLAIAYFSFGRIVRIHRPEAAAAAIRRARARVRSREKDLLPLDLRSARAALPKAKAGEPCPACAERPLEGGGPNVLFRRAPLRCPRCRLEIPFKATQLGYGLAGLVAAICAIGGALAILAAREAVGQQAFMVRAGIGGALLLGMFLIVWGLQGTGDAAAARAIRDRRRRLARMRGEKTSDTAPEDDSARALVQENLEAVVVAVILALVIRHFVMEAFVIPTGSMAPTLYGDHFVFQCQHCGWVYAKAKRENELTSSDSSQKEDGVCQLCGGETSRVVTPRDVEGGNKILVNKFEQKLRPVRRWEVIVFKFPDNPTRNFIKRCVGLPGEHIWTDDRGDLHVGPMEPRGLPERKPREVQEELWMPVYDGRYHAKDLPEPWEPFAANGNQAPRWKVGENSLVADKGPGETWLKFTRPIKDSYSYNSGSGSVDVGDVRVRATITPNADSKEVALALVTNNNPVVVKLPVGAGDTEVSIVRGDEVLAKGRVPALAAGHANHVSFHYVDCRVALEIEGKEVLAADDLKAPQQINVDSSHVRLGADAAGASFTDVKIDRDIYYLPGWGGYKWNPREGVDIPDDCYFAMGDNSPNSEDGRKWGFVHQAHMIGHAFFVFWPPSQWKPIR